MSWMIAVAMAGGLATVCSMMGMGEPGLPTYAATLEPGAGIASTGKGAGTFTYDAATHTLSYNVTYEGLTGPAVAAHIHGPADPDANGPPVVSFANAASPITSTATLTDAQATDLMSGRYYVNVHTAANKGGEIRGQILPKMAGR